MSGPDVETKALNSSVKTLAECDESARERIMRYLVARFLPNDYLAPRGSVKNIATALGKGTQD